MKKLVILHTEESNGWGGQEIRIVSEMAGMKARGHRLILATPSHAKIYDRAKAAGIEVFPVSMKKSDLISGAMRIAGIIKREGVDIINTHSSRDSWMGSIAGRITGIKVVRTRHISSTLNKSPLTKLVYGPLCDVVITTGEFIKKQVARELGLQPVKIRSIPTGIDISRFESADGSKLRAELGLSESAIILGSAAALRSWKGHQFIIKALPEILRDFPEAVLVFAGEGPLRYFLGDKIDEAGVKGKVILLGQREDVADVIKGFDISILASFASEGIPQFVLQSMACKKPVVGTTVGGIPEVVEDGKSGYLVPPNDPAAIAEAVKKILNEPGAKERMGEEGFRMVTERHSHDMMLDQLEAMYAELLGK